jgi:capsular polysaccharide biosynthesis protein
MEKPSVVKTVGDAVWHRKLLIGAIVAVVMAAGVALYSVTPPTYEAQAQVYVDPGADQALQQGEGLLIRDIAQQATSRRVLARAGLQLAGSLTPEQLAPRITAAVVQAPNLVVITASAGSPAGAAELANAVAVAVVGQHRANSAQRDLRSQTLLTGELARLAQVLTTDQSTGASTEQQNLDRQDYTNTYGRLQDLQLRQTRAADSVSVSQQALAPDRSVNPDLFRYLGVAGVAGVFVALLVAMLVERFDDRVFDSEAVANMSGAPLVVVTTNSHRADPDELPAQYTLAYAHIAARYPNARTIMVTASSHRESTDPVAAAFGDAAELAGDHAIVLQRQPSPDPTPANNSGKRRRWPLVSRLGKELALMTEAAGPPETQTLQALAIASLEWAAAARPEPPALRTFVAVPAPFLSPKAASLAHVVDVAIVVAVARATRMAEVVRTAECLRQVGVEPVAVVLVHKKSARSAMAEPNGTKIADLADSITVRPGDDAEGLEYAHPRSATLTTDITEPAPAETDEKETITIRAATAAEAKAPVDRSRAAIPDAANRAQPIRQDENPIEPIPEPVQPFEATPTETSRIDAVPIEIAAKAEDLAVSANGVARRRGDAPNTIKVDKLLVATPSAVKNKAHNLAVRAGSTVPDGEVAQNSDQGRPGSPTKTGTKAYRIKTRSG